MPAGFPFRSSVLAATFGLGLAFVTTASEAQAAFAGSSAVALAPLATPTTLTVTWANTATLADIVANASYQQDVAELLGH